MKAINKLKLYQFDVGETFYFAERTLPRANLAWREYAKNVVCLDDDDPDLHVQGKELTDAEMDTMMVHGDSGIIGTFREVFVAQAEPGYFCSTVF